MGCSGGGGSGGGDEPDPVEDAYTGITTPAEIDENNATDIAAGQTGTVMTSSEASPHDQGPTDLQIDNF